MLKQSIKIIYLYTILLAFCQSILAADLLEVFRQALSTDPQLQMVKFKQSSNKQNVPINRANLLPNLSGNGQYTRQAFSSNSRINPYSSSLSLNINQPLFNIANWLTYRAAKLSSTASDLIYGAALQDLMVRTAQAYFDVLQAQDQLALDKANIGAYNQLLQQNQIRFNAGLMKTVDIDNARAAVANSSSTLFEDQNILAEKLANLQAITGINYSKLAPLQSHFPLVSPQPENLQSWLQTVNEKNLTVLADRYTAQADKETIKANFAGHYPSLDATANYTHNNNNSFQYASRDSGFVGLTLTMPLYAGGKVNAQTLQAAYNFQNQLSQTTLDYRTAINQAETNYAIIINDIAKLRADETAIAADQKALTSNQLAYKAGISSISISDLITAQQTLYQARMTAINDKYHYLMAVLKLKQAAGTLSITDLEQINAWLQY